MDCVYSASRWRAQIHHLMERCSLDGVYFLVSAFVISNHISFYYFLSEFVYNCYYYFIVRSEALVVQCNVLNELHQLFFRCLHWKVA